MTYKCLQNQKGSFAHEKTHLGIASLIIGLSIPSSAMAALGPGDLSPEEGLSPEEIQSVYIGQSYHSKQVILGARANGLQATVVYDLATDHIYIDAPYGSFDVGLNQAALQAAQGNQSLASSMASDLRASFSTPHSFEIMTGTFGVPTYDPPSGIGGPCDLSPCGPWGYTNRDHPEDSYLGGRFWDSSVDPYWELIYTDEEIEEDKEAFDQAKDQWCDQEISDALQVLAALLTGTPACLAAANDADPWSGAACAGATVVIFDGFRSSAGDKCHQAYPGPDQWQP